MSFLVLAYPKISMDDYQFIQSIRRKHDDRYYNVVEPHFTIVFPVFNIDNVSMIKHLEKTCKNTEVIEFVLRTTVIVKDSFSEYTDIFLVPDEGNSQIIKLHDKLYTGILSDALRHDIPFIPHIGIGASTDASEAKRIADEINCQNVFISGKINSLDIVEYEYPKVTTAHKFLLK